jgi:hypothetical protein
MLRQNGSQLPRRYHRFAPPRGEIRISSVRELLYQLRDLGTQFGAVRYDSWGSEESIQILKSQGFSAINLSVMPRSKFSRAFGSSMYSGSFMHKEIVDGMRKLLKQIRLGNLSLCKIVQARLDRI